MTPGKERGICTCGHPSDAHCLEAAGSDNKQGWKAASETKHGLGSCGWTGDGAFCTCEEYQEASVKYTVWAPMSSRFRVEGEGESRPLTPAEKLKYPHADRMVESVRVDNVRWRPVDEGK